MEKETFKSNMALIVRGHIGIIRCFINLVRKYPLQTAVIILTATNVAFMVSFVRERVKVKTSEYEIYKLNEQLDSVKNKGVRAYCTFQRYKPV